MDVCLGAGRCDALSSKSSISRRPASLLPTRMSRKTWEGSGDTRRWQSACRNEI
jgi:hypothetical protein